MISTFRGLTVEVRRQTNVCDTGSVRQRQKALGLEMCDSWWKSGLKRLPGVGDI